MKTFNEFGNFGYQVLALALFWAVSSFLALPSWQFIILAIPLVWIFPFYRKHILFASSLLYSIFIFDFQSWAIFTNQQSKLYFEQNYLWLNIVFLFFTYGISYTLIKRRQWGLVGRQSHFIVFGIYNALVILAASFGLSLYFKYFLLIFGHYLLFLGLVIQEQCTTGYQFKFLDFAFFRPTWTSSRAFPRISSFATLSDSVVQRFSDFKDPSKSAFYLLSQSVLLLIVCDFVYFLKFGHFEYLKFMHLDIPNLEIPRSHLSLKHINSMNLSISETWLVMLLTYLIYLLKVTYWGNIYIASARMMGFPLYRMAYRPWEARSLNDFFRRVHFYYYEIIRLLFFYPLLKLIKFRGFERRLFWGTFGAIFLGGGIQFHLFGFPEVAFKQSLEQIIWTWVPAGIYHLIFATLLGYSVLNEVKIRRLGKVQGYLFWSTRGLFVSIFYLWTLSWIIAWGPEWPKPDFSDQIKFSFWMLGVQL